MEETAKAYIAGFIDGEGFVDIHRQSTEKTMKSRNIKSPSFQPIVQISNSNRDVLEWIKSLYGGNLYARAKKAGHKQIYSYVVTARKAEHLLKEVLPFLIVKKEQAQLVLEFYANGEHGKLRTSPEELNRRESIYSILRSLNYKGDSRPQRLSEVPPELVAAQLGRDSG